MTATMTMRPNSGQTSTAHRQASNPVPIVAMVLLALTLFLPSIGNGLIEAAHTWSGTVADSVRTGETQAVTAGEVPDGLSAVEWESIQDQIAAASAATVIPTPEIPAILPRPDDFSATLTSVDGISGVFDGAVVEISSSGSDLAVELSTSTIGNVTQTAVGERTATGVEFDRGLVTEWFETRASGIEHGYTIDAPVSTGTDLAITVAVGGGTPSLIDADSAMILRPDGTSLYYRGLHAFDAEGTVLDAHMSVADRKIILHVDTTGAVYPIVVDPILTEDQKLSGNVDAPDSASLGEAIALDGNRLAVGVPFEIVGGVTAGVVQIFERVDAASPWGLVTTIESPIGENDAAFGSSIALSGDRIAIDVSPADDNASVLVYEQIAPETWTQTGDPIASVTSQRDSLGVDLAFATEDRLLVAMPAFNGSFGQVVQYDFDGDTFLLTSFISPAAPDFEDQFGYSIDTTVALDGTPLLIVGSPGDDDAGTDAGAVFVFEDRGSGYEQSAKVTGDGSFDAGDRIGTAVAASGPTIAAAGLGNEQVGDPYSVMLIEDGEAGFEVTYSLEDALAVPAEGDSARYLPNDYIDVVGRNVFAARPGGGGQIGVFRSIDGGQLRLTDQIQPIGRETGDRIGLAVAADGDTVVAGAPGDDDEGTDNGAAYSTQVAITGTFIGTDGDYDTPSNWDTGLVPGADDTAVIGADITSETQISEAQSVGVLVSLTTNSVAITPTGALTIDSFSSERVGSFLLGGLDVNGVITLDSQGAPVSISGPAWNINGRVVKTGGGEFAIEVAEWNSFLGGTVDVQAGELIVDAVVDTVEAASVTIGAGATLQYLGTVTLDPDGIYDFAITGPASDTNNYGRVIWDSGISSNADGLIRSTLDGYSPSVDDDYPVLSCNADCSGGDPSFDIDPFEASRSNTGIVLRLATFDTNVDIDGDWVAVGVPSADQVFIVRNIDGVWTDVQTIDAPVPDNLFGWNVTLAVPALAITTEGVDRVDVYELDSVGTFVRKQAVTGSAQSGFGREIDAEGTRLIVGAPDDDTAGTDAGRAVAYDLSDLDAGLPVVFDVTPGVADDRFGVDVVATTGDFWVSADNDAAAAVTAQQGTVWRLNAIGATLTKVVSQTPNDGAGFGGIIDADQGRLVASEAAVSGELSNVQLFDVAQGQNRIVSAPGTVFGALISGDRVYARSNTIGQTVVLSDNGDDGAYTQIDTIADPVTVPFDASADGGVFVLSREAVGTPTSALDFLDFATVPEPVPGKVVAPIASTNDQFGTNVAIDGDTLVVSASLFDGPGGFNVGTVHVFLRTAPGVWTPTQRIDGTAARPLGGAVAVQRGVLALASSGDGVALYSRAGAASPFVDDEGFLTTPATPRSIAIDGDVLVVGIPQAGDGQVNVYDGGSESWQSGTEQIIGAPGLNGADAFGHQVDISGDRIAIGAPASTSFNALSGDSGFVETWFRDGEPGTAFAFEGRTQAPGVDTYLGWSVAVEGDVVVAGAPRQGSGVVEVIDAPSATSLGSIADGINNSFGYAVDIDSGIIAVGDFSSTQRTYNAATLAATETLVHSDFENGDNTLGSIPIATSNGTIVSGARLEDMLGRDAGAVYTFDVALPEAGAFAAPDGDTNDGFGESVAIHENLMVVGTMKGNGAAADSGNAYVFERASQSDSWTFVTELEASDGATGDRFGFDVAISGSRLDVDADLGNAIIAVGAPFRDGTDNGAVYIFRYDPILDNWIETEQILGEFGDEFFGSSVDIQQRTVAFRNGGYRVVIGAPSDVAPSMSLFSYVVTENPTLNDTLTLLDRETGVDGSRFGTSVAIDGNSVVAGATAAAQSSGPSGLAFAYRIGTTGDMSLEAVLQQPAGDDDSADEFGHRVDIDQDIAVVTARTDSTDGPNRGAAFVFERAGTTWGPAIELVPGAHVSDGGLFGRDAVVENGIVAVSTQVAAPTNDGGSISIFDTVSGTWTESQVFERNTGSTDDRFGYSLALGEDGVLLAGAPGVDTISGAGAGLVKVLDVTIPDAANKINGLAGPGDDSQLGSAIDVDGEWMIVSEPQVGPGTGRAHMFRSDGATWQHFTELVDPEGPSGANDQFGFQVAVGGNWAAVTDRGDKIALWNFDGTTWNPIPSIAIADNDEAEALAIDGANDRLIAGRDEGGSPGEARIFDLLLGGAVANTLTVPADIEASDGFGSAVEIDGNLAFIGARLDDIGTEVNAGSVRWFARAGTTWAQIGVSTETIPDAFATFGSRVEVDGDSGRMVVGAPGRNRALVFTIASGPDLVTAALSSSGASRLGTSVAIDDNLIVAGARSAAIDGVLTGTAVVFAYDGTTWTETAVLSASDREMADGFGHAAGLSADQIVVAAPLDANDGGVFAGGLYTYAVAQPIQPEPANKIFDPTPVPNDDFGSNVAVAGDRLLVRSTDTVHEFVRAVDGTWTFDNDDAIPGADASGVALAHDPASGNYVASVSRFAGFTGSVDLYRRVAGAWETIGSLDPDTGDDGFGSAVDLDLVGTTATLAVGAPDGTVPLFEGPGAAYLFEIDVTTATISPLAKIIGSIATTGPTGTLHAGFGSSIAIDGGTLVVGARYAEGATETQGSAAVFTADNSTRTSWTEDAILTFCGVEAGGSGAVPTACPSAASAFFATDVDVDGGTVVVGSPAAGARLGAVSVFEQAGSDWSLVAQPTVAAGASGDDLGSSVEIRADVIIATAAGVNSGSGAAYVFREVNGAWAESRTLAGSDSSPLDRFGSSLSLSEAGVVIVGSPNTDALGIDATGAAYAFGVVLVDTPSLTFDFDLAPGSPPSVDVAPTGIAVTEFNPSVVDSGNADDANLASTPLSAVELDDTPLSATTIGETPLSATVLDSAPLSATSLVLIDVDGGWPALLAGTDLENVPLQGLTFGQALTDPVVFGRIQALPLSAVDVRGTPLSAVPLSAVVLGSTPLSAVPLSATGSSVTWCEVITPYFPAGTCTDDSDLTDVTLLEATLAGTPLSAVPLSAVPLSAVPLSATPLSAVPLSATDFVASPLSAVPLSAVPLSAVGATGAPLSAVPLSAVPLSAVPLSATELDAIVVNGTPLSATPLSATGVAGAPLSAVPVSIPLSAVPLSATSVDGAPLSATPLSAVPLSAVVLGALPLSAVPLSATGGAPLDWCDFLAGLDGDVDCDHGVDPNTTTLAELSVRGVPLSAVPLSATPLSATELVGLPLSAVPLSAVPLSAVSLEAVDLGLIDLQGTPLSAVDPGATPLSAVPLSAVPLSAVDITGSPLSAVPLSAVPLSATLFAATPLSAVPLSAVPLSATPLSAVTLSAVPLSATPLSAVDLVTSPLSAVPLSAVPLSAVGVDCALVDCGVDTLGDAAVQGAIDLTATLEDLQPALSGYRFSDLAIALTGVTSDELRAALDAAGLFLVDLDGFDDVTIGDLPSFLPALAQMTLADLDGALFSVSLGDLVGALIDPRTGTAFSDEDTLLALRTALDDLGLDIADVDSLGDFTLGDLLTGPLGDGDAAIADLTLGDLGPILGFISVATIIEYLGITGFTSADLDPITLGDLDPAELGNLLLAALFGQGITQFDTLELGEFIQDLDDQGLLEGFTLGDLLLLLSGATNLPFGGFDFTSVDVDSLPPGTVPAVSFDASFTMTSSARRSVQVTVELPGTASYIAGSSKVSSGFPLTPIALEPEVGDNTLTWTFTGVSANDDYSINFDVLPTVTLGTTALNASARVLGTDVIATGVATVQVAEGLEVNDFPPPFVTAAAEDTIYLTYISSSDDIDVFEIAVQDNDRLVVELSNLDADLDMALYVDPTDDAVGAPLTGTNGRAPVFPVVDPDQNGADAEPLQDFVRLDEIVADLELVAVSNTAGLDNELINTDRLPAGTYYVQVFGANGAVTRDPAALQLDLIEAENRPVCQPLGALPPVTAGTAPSLAGTSANTLFLINESRIEQIYGLAARTDVVSKLDELTTYLGANPGLGIDPIVVPVDGYAEIRSAYDAWDSPANPELACDPEVANTVVAAINSNIVDPLRDQLTHVVIIGGDDQIPMARLEDATLVANEYDFRHEFDGDLTGADADAANAFTSVFWEKRFLSDEPYGEAAAQSLGNRFLYVSDLALGRLVETPTDIVKSLDHYINFDGTLDATSATVLGYDFLSDGSEQIAADLAAGGLAVDGRYADGEDAGNVWDRAIAEAQLVGAGSNALISLNAHFDHYRALPAIGDQVPGFDDNLIATEVAALLPDGLTQSLIFSMGCHSGLAVPDGQIAQTNTDWAQQIASTGGIYIANTGFGYGDTETVAYTEALMAAFARRVVDPILLDGVPAPTTIGQALMFAKNEYAAGLGVFSVYDEKALMESTFYGLPFYQVGFDGTPDDPAPDNNTVIDASGTEVLPINVRATNDENDVDRGVYYSNTDDDGIEETIVAPGRPIQPSVTADISVVDDANTAVLDRIAHGAIVLSMESTYVPAPDPVVATPIFDEAADQAEPDIGDVIFPAKPLTINTTTTPSGTRQSIVVATGQYRSSTATQRLDDDLDAVVFYQDPSVSDFTAPTITKVTSTLENGLLTVSLNAADLAGIDRVYLLVGSNPGVGSVSWTGLDLANTSGNAWSGSLQLPAGTTSAAFVAQAKDANGNVGVASKKATNFSDDIVVPTDPPPTPGLDVIVDDTALDAASGWYTAEVAVAVDSGSVGATVSIDGAAPQPITGGGFVVTGDGIHTFTVTTANGRVSTGTVRIDTTGPPTVTLGTPIDGSSYEATAGATYDVICRDPSLTVCTLLQDGNPVENGDPLPTTPGDYVLVVHAEDVFGNTTDRSTSFTITGGPDPEPPVIIEVDGPMEPTITTETVNIVAMFDDPQLDGDGTDYTVAIDWGDLGTSTTCSVDDSDGPECSITAPTSTASGMATGSHVYSAPGVYSVTVTITDETGLSASEVFEFIVIYDPGAGRVSGSGWFISGPEAQPGDPDFDFARFGFNARYRTNSVAPVGRATLRIPSEFEFKSVSYDYLIINDSIAVAEGVGKVGNDDGYRFRVQAIDYGWIDFIQISIWDDETGEIFYDNGVLYEDGDLVLWGGVKIRP